jgi:hypothetical protein
MFNCHAIYGVDECIHLLPWALAPEWGQNPKEKNHFTFSIA